MIPKFPEENLEQLAIHYKAILGNLGEDPEREGLLKTPMRVAKAMDFLTHGYRQDPKAILESALFHEDYKQIVVVKDIEIYSMCEHHLLPFFGKAHIACGGVLRPPAAASGETHHPDQELPPRSAESPRSGRGHRGPAPLHVDAWHPEAELRDHHIGVHRRIPQERKHAPGVHAPHRSRSALIFHASDTDNIRIAL